MREAEADSAAGLPAKSGGNRRAVSNSAPASLTASGFPKERHETL